MGVHYWVVGIAVASLLGVGLIGAAGPGPADGSKASACGPWAHTYLVIFILAPVNNNTSQDRGFLLTYFDGVDELFAAQGTLGASKPERYDFSDAHLRNVTAKQAACDMRTATQAARIFGEYQFDVHDAFKGGVLGTGQNGSIDHLKQIIDPSFFDLEPELCSPSDDVLTMRFAVDGGPKDRHSVELGHSGSCSLPSVIYGILDGYGTLYYAADDAASGRPSPPETLPVVNFATDEAADRLVVNSASSEADWGRLALRTNNSLSVGGSEAPHQNQPATNASGVTPLGPSSMVMVSDTSTLIRAGDYLGFCGTTGDVAEARITIVDVSANMIIGEFVFVNVAACA